MDVLDGQNLYSLLFDFTYTAPLNDMFEHMDMGDKNFIMNSGSYFIIIFISGMYFLAKKMMNKLAVKYSYNSNPWH